MQIAPPHPQPTASSAPQPTGRRCAPSTRHSQCHARLRSLRCGSASEREGASQSIPCGHLIGACSPQSGQRQWLYNGTTWQEHSLTRLCRWYQLASLRDHGFWQDSQCETNPCQGDEQEYQPVWVIYHCGSNAVIGLVARTPQCGRRPLRQSSGCWPLAPVTCYGRRWRTREADDYGT